MTGFLLQIPVTLHTRSVACAGSLKKFLLVYWPENHSIPGYVCDQPRPSNLQSRMSFFLIFDLYAVFKVRNGDGEIRTLDPLLARQVLSQLSYTPKGFLI